MDQKASEDYGISVRSLMETAGQRVFEEVKRTISAEGTLTVLCGKGNNGGDGFVVARLAHQAGYSVDCLVACKESDLGREPRFQAGQTKEAGVPLSFAGDPLYDSKLINLSSRDLLVDALLGTGAAGEVRGPIQVAIQSINRSGTPVLSIDIPSGVHCDTGEELGESVWATKTVTLALPKPFLFQGTGQEHSGQWDIAHIGFPSELLEEPSEAQLLDMEWVANVIPQRLRASHKGDNGHVLIIAGSAEMPGAAVMSAKAALRSGAGLFTVAAIPQVCEIVAHHLPECIFLPLPEAMGGIDVEASEYLLEQQDRFDSALFGPGLSQRPEVQTFLGRVWQDWELPSVIDADALNAVAKGIALPRSECVLTPHPGEMSRLLKASIAEVQSDRFSTVSQATEQFGKCVLLKGLYSMVGDRSQPISVNRTGNPGMATGGMGDILGGVIATLLGQTLPSYHAAAAAMYWHGLAGDICAKEIGTIGYSAMDVANALPHARAKIVASCEYEA